MSQGNRSFWSTVPGLVTGAASILTATVALIGTGVSLGWFGSKDDADKVASAVTSTTSPSPVAGVTTTLGRTGTTAAPSLSPLQATPAPLTFDSLGPRDQQVTVRNTTAAALTLRRPSISGVDASQFTATDLTCGTSLDANRTCEVKVTFLATKAGTSTATLVIKPEGPPALEVPLRGSRLI